MKLYKYVKLMQILSPFIWLLVTAVLVLLVMDLTKEHGEYSDFLYIWITLVLIISIAAFFYLTDKLHKMLARIFLRDILYDLNHYIDHESIFTKYAKHIYYYERIYDKDRVYYLFQYFPPAFMYDTGVLSIDIELDQKSGEWKLSKPFK